MDIGRDERLIYFEAHTDERGSLVAINEFEEVPFEIKRVFYIYDVPEFAQRANHSHIYTDQVLIAIQGNFTAQIQNEVYMLCSREVGLWVRAGENVKLHSFSDDAICLVLCSTVYREDDYIEAEAEKSKFYEFSPN